MAYAQNNQLIYTDNDKQFLRVWKRNWPVPKDWTPAQIYQEISSFCDWSDFINQESVSMDVFLKCLEHFAGAEYAPRFYDVRQEYNRRTNRSHNRNEGDCAICEKTGVLYVVQDVQDRNAPVIPPARRSHQFTKSRITTIPCSCATGKKLNATNTSEGDPLYGYDNDMLSRLQNVAFSTPWAAMKFAGVVNPDEQPEQGETSEQIESMKPDVQSFTPEQLQENVTEEEPAGVDF